MVRFSLGTPRSHIIIDDGHEKAILNAALSTMLAQHPKDGPN
jgi:hypothetical protein